jgi:hypothetical protein
VADRVEHSSFGAELPRRFVEVRSGEFAPEVVIAAGSAASASGNPVAGDQSLTVAGSAVALTVPSGATSAMLTVETAPIRVSLSGTPTASSGLYYDAGSTLEITGTASLAGLKMIRATGVSAVVNVSYFS